LICTLNPSAEILNSKQICVKYENYYEDGSYLSTDCFSNDKCKYTFHENPKKLTQIVDFEKKLIKISPEEEEDVTYTFDENFNAPDSFDAIEIPVFEIKKTDKTKEICGVSCKNLEATYKDDVYKIWYFIPKKIKADRINKYTGYKQIPGIILEIICNDELQKKAISIDDKCKF